MNKVNLPTVVIIGRTNIGKSTLFNRLSVDVKSLVLDQEGVTRDFLKDIVCWQDKCFELIDTGGIHLRKTQDPLLEATRQRALGQIREADIILFMCDGKVGILPEDRELSKFLHKLGKTIFLVVNKVDAHVSKEYEHEFQQLGHKYIYPLSAQHGTGIVELLEKIVNTLATQPLIKKIPALQCRVVILGKPNVGKSSLMNMLIKQERAIVTDVPGTTREAISERIQFYKAVIQLTDTPGIRKKRAVTEPLENLMVKSAFSALKDADIVLLVVDATEGKISDQELKLMFYAFGQKYKAIILLFNKQDIIDEYAQETLKLNLEQYDYFIKKIVRLDISCKTSKNVGRILSLIEKVWGRYSQTFSDEELTQLLKEALQKKPLYRQEQMLHVYSARQIKTAPITILLRVNKPKFFESSQLAFFERILRGAYELRGVPIRFVIRKK